MVFTLRPTSYMIHNYEFKSHFKPTPVILAAVRVESPSPFAPQALYQQVAERLREQIFNRELEPGSWIDEQKIAVDYGISRTPLREALKVLAVEGLVTMKVRRGAYVTEMSVEDVTQVYHLLGLLEADAAAQAAQLATDAQLAELQALHQQLESLPSQRDAFFRSNEEFHLRLLALGGNRWREQVVGDLRKMMKLNRHHSLFRQGRIEESLAEHRELMAALLRRDGEASAHLMRRHFENGLVAARQE
jgi:DNA-binding GntR family transcriptional regulator